MKYNVDKKKFRTLLYSRPALIKKVVDLDESDAAFFVEKGKHLYEFLPMELRTNLKVVRAYIKDEGETDPYNRYRYRRFNAKKIPLSVLDKLTPDERKILIRNACSSWNGYEFFDSLPDKTYEEWLEAVKCGYKINDVPEEYRTRKSLYKAYAFRIREDHTNTVHDTITEEFWTTANADSDIEELIKYTRHFIEVVPPTRVKKEHLIAAFQSGADLTLATDYENIPSSSWDRGVITMALKCNKDNIRIIPPSLLNENDAITAANDGVDFNYIPPQIVTRKVKIHIAAHRIGGYDTEYGGKPEFNDVYDPDFQEAVLKEGGRHACDNIQCFVKREDRHRMLAACPFFIKYIPKLEQTEKTIDILLENASREDLNGNFIAQFINLGKIKKHHAPILVGCDHNLLVTAMEKRFRGIKKAKKMSKEEAEAMQEKKTGWTIAIDIAPGEFAKIREQLDKKE